MFILVVIIVLYVFIDVNYVIRTFFAVLSGRFYQSQCSLDDVTTIYGLCTLQDCDITFKYMRLARLLRDLDFARYHFYDRTGVYQLSRQLKVKSLQGCTFTLTEEPVPLFAFYKINTKLIYWDDRSLFFEHEVVTLHDGKIRLLLVSRQHAIGENGNSAEVLLKGLPGSEHRRPCPEYIKHWFESMRITSENLRK